MDPLAMIEAWTTEIAAAVMAVASGAGGIIYGNHRRSKKNARRLEGDDSDPNTPGLMEMAYESNRKLDHLEERMEQQHRMLMDEVRELKAEGKGPGQSGESAGD